MSAYILIMSKKKKSKKKSIQYKSSGTVKYGSDKMAVAAVCLFPVFCSIIVKNAMFILYSVPIFFPWIIFTLFVFRFCVKYDIIERKIYYRYFFKFRSADFFDIQRIYKKSDGRTTFLIIKTNRRKIGINMRSCEGVRELEFFLRRHMIKKFKE